MTVGEYVERIKTAKTHAEAFAVTREAIAEANAGRLTVDEWNEVWRSYDKRVQPERYYDRTWTGD